MFVEVDKKDLVLGKEYTIVSSYDKGIYITATLIRNIVGYGQKFENPIEHSGDTYNTLLRIRNKKNNPNYFDFVTLSVFCTTPRHCLDCHSKLPYPSKNHIAKMDPTSPKFANWSPQLRCTPCARARHRFCYTKRINISLPFETSDAR